MVIAICFQATMPCDDEILRACCAGSRAASSGIPAKLHCSEVSTSTSVRARGRHHAGEVPFNSVAVWPSAICSASGPVRATCGWITPPLVHYSKAPCRHLRPSSVILTPVVAGLQSGSQCTLALAESSMAMFRVSNGHQLSCAGAIERHLLLAGHTAAWLVAKCATRSAVSCAQHHSSSLGSNNWSSEPLRHCGWVLHQFLCGNELVGVSHLRFHTVSVCETLMLA